MPSNAWRRTAGLLPLAAIGSVGANYPPPNQVLISTVSREAVGEEIAGQFSGVYGSNTYPAANRALAVPFSIAHPFLVRKVWWFNGTTATTDSADVGVYTEAGARIVSGGGTAIATASALQEVDVTDTLLQPGRYWLAYSQNGTTATPYQSTVSAVLARVLGAAQMDSAYVLPSTFTPAAVSAANLPVCGIASRTLAA